MICEEFQEELSAWVDGELTPDERIRLSAHLETCAACSNALHTLKLTSLLMRGLETPEAPARVTDAAMRLVREGTQSRTESTIVRFRRVCFEPLWPKLGWEGMGLAAALVLAAVVYRGELLGGGDHTAALSPAATIAGSDRANEPPPVVTAQNEVQATGRAEVPDVPQPVPAAPRPAPAVGQISSAVAPAMHADFNPQQQAVSADESSTIDLPPIIEFAAINDQLSVLRPTPVFVAPDKNAPRRYTVKAGTRVEVIAKSKDGTWAWVTTADGAPAYILMSDLGRST
jgi:anti-sigma factor RsiW